MNRIFLGLGVSVALLTAATPLFAQQARVTFGGQVRPRMESRSEGGDTRETFTSMRVRAQIQALLAEGASVFIQVQDVRLFGEETSTLGDFKADAFDLHQGYLELGVLSGIEGSLRVGRQVMAFGEQRLVGSVEWTQQGRSFDGLRYTASPFGALELDLFAMKLQERSSARYDFDGEFLGAYGTVDLKAVGSLDLYGLLTTDSRESGTDEHTLGALWKGTAGPLTFRFEGSVQGGEREGVAVSAYMVGARTGLEVRDRASVTFWYDHLSGDPDPDDDEVEVFNTLFATNHAFYGAADYFLNIPVHTGGLGLRDAALKLAVNPSERTGLGVDLHAFSTTEPGDLSTRNLAREIDVTLTHRLDPGLTAVAGFSYVQVQDGMIELGRLEDDATWAFVMLNAVF